MRKLVSAGAVLLALALAACSAPAARETGPSDEGGASTPATDDATPMRVAYASDLDPNDIADQIGLTAAGAKVDFLTEDSAVVAGLQNGNYDIGNIDVTAAIKAIQAGVPLKIVYVSQDSPEFVMVAQKDVTDLAQLAGKRVAYHAPGSLTEILQRELIKQNAPELESQIAWTVLPESPNRAAAMVAGRIDATTLEYLDVLALQDQGEFNVLGSWADLTGSSGNAIATAWVVSTSYLAENRDAIVAFLRQIQAGYDTTYADKDAWMDLASLKLPDVMADHLAKAYTYYTESQMYPKTGTVPITRERWNGLDEFFRQIGEYDQAAPLDMVDLDVVAEINAP